MAIGNLANRFGIPVLIPGGRFNARMLRDHFKRQQSAEHEVTVNALRYISRNTTLPPRARIEAQLQMAAMPNYTKIMSTKNRCTLSGRGRAVFRAFRLNRFTFRQLARAGKLSGVIRAMW
ncbi:hypothetical protein BABINDRAFT_161404 [Babjeviella inositovora NRRL Y-12698]|uniref:37S ribosomal protein MRP2, mitochondrial n=1 Tax=Babjeviella inositovora NRRL Y-12698 TaxID=984486 RepID=A0A1E3QQD1_9ASCO|nr:uncharacterized protein BABINDRAFT_161404 [Babjeviella inositovora NRRL Y-12698]ODQ79684.1 hypothetical protein BABINDRAFT_161404 [Babjeviella inositovora NRRL Y-12698]